MQSVKKIKESAAVFRYYGGWADKIHGKTIEVCFPCISAATYLVCSLLIRQRRVQQNSIIPSMSPLESADKSVRFEWLGASSMSLTSA